MIDSVSKEEVEFLFLPFSFFVFVCGKINHFSLYFLPLLLGCYFFSTNNSTKMSFMLDEIPYGWPGPPGNAAAERLSSVPLSRPAFFSHKRAVAKEIVQAIKAVLGGVETVHEALLKALERGEVRGRRGCGRAERDERENEDDERTKRATTAKQASLSFVHFFSLCFHLKRPALSPRRQRSIHRGRQGIEIEV